MDILLLIVSFLIGIMLLYILGLVLVVPVKILFKLLTNAVIGGVTLLLFNLFGSLIGLNLIITPLSAILVGLLGVPGVVLLLLYQLL